MVGLFPALIKENQKVQKALEHELESERAKIEIKLRRKFYLALDD
jgi:hypothetical protein